MKAGRWLLLAAAITLLPSAALAQKKKGGKKPPAAAPAAAPAPADAPPTAPAGGGEIELDQPPAAAGAAGVSGDASATGAAGADVGASAAGTGDSAGSGICEIDPSACPKPEDIARAASKTIHAEVYAVEQIYALRYHRLELEPYWGFTLNDQFVGHPGPGLAANFYISNVLAIGVNGNYYGSFNSDSDFNFENRRSAYISVPLTQYQWGANLNFTYVPVYGKFAGFNEFIFSYDAYIVGGVGAISTRPIPVIDPNNRSFDYKPKIDFNVGLGLRIFLNRWFAATLELRDYIFNEQLENLNVGTAAPSTTGGIAPRSPQDPATWYGENKLTNALQAQIGVSIFLPFSWEYRLPK